MIITGHRMNSENLKIDGGWTLFLDRDGVINKRVMDDYIRSWQQFEFLPGVRESVRILSGIFGKIIIVSNQQGIGKGLMSEADLEKIHQRMADEIEKEGGKIDRTYHSPFLETDNSILRKPNIGMALRARKEFPGINFKKSVMIGDSLSDMVFGKRLKMKTVFLSQDMELIRKGHTLIDFVYPDLISFTRTIMKSP